MAIVAVVIALFSLALSVVTFISFMVFMTKKEVGIDMFRRPEQTEYDDNIKADKAETELENFTPDFEKPVNIKFL